MVTRIRKWGNSLGLRIPRSFAEEARVGDGSEVDLTARPGCLMVKPVRPQRARYSLRALLSRVNADNLHGAVDWGRSAGRETW